MTSSLMGTLCSISAVFLSCCVIGLPLLFVYHWDDDVVVQLMRAGV